ncbi:ABC-F type ribosomal protection protein [Paenibacillus alvei]|uniref:ABC-F type ribosomal protection protein n=1 Tax=Paenibacillus alvei TaxID=44250 RepID=A0ABT4GZ70_PAEAL|nr:ABC-F type ribosomal protection protein [Paenibacillus alvei]MCY9762017.1 ABC-F type ribosomal protection protein [Paenibacillus alvei]MCY9768593.1 ABC-F type ribosomal protection protein [Paenibacillus alvei]
MTLLLSCRKLAKAFGDLQVLRNVQLDIAKGDRIGLVGCNGAGKTTLAQLLYGTEKPDAGVITCYGDSIDIGYLRQSTSYSVQMFREMSECMLEKEGASSFMTATSMMGVSQVQSWEMERVRHMSGGERTKMALAHIWSTRPHLLLLDEPTNHLDLDGVEWLIRELNAYDGSMIVISHDRYFLDRTVQRIIELEDGVAHEYMGNYSAYRDEKARRYQNQLHQYETEQKYKAKIEAEILRLEQWSSKAHREAGKVGKMIEMRTGIKEFYRTKAKKMDRQVKSRIKRLRRLEYEGIQKPREEQQIYFEFDHPEKRGRRMLEANRIRKSVGNKLLFQDSSFTVQRGDRIGLLGPNGCGKSTLIRMLIGQLQPDKGEIWLSPSIKPVYLSQELDELDTEQCALEWYDSESLAEVRTVLAQMGIESAMLMKPMKRLSLGERMRFKIANLIVNHSDVLVLDEPTNHLDLQSRTQLEETLTSYSGTMLIASHDRYFLERVCHKWLVFHDGKVTLSQRPLSQAVQIGSVDARRSEQMPSSIVVYDRLMVEHKLSQVLAELSLCKPGDKKYAALDKEYQLWINRKKHLEQSNHN